MLRVIIRLSLPNADKLPRMWANKYASHVPVLRRPIGKQDYGIYPESYLLLFRKIEESLKQAQK